MVVKTSKTKKISTETLLQRFVLVFDAQLDHIEARLAAIAKDLAGKKTKKNAVALEAQHARLIRQASLIAGEVRKLDVGARRSAENLSPALVMAFLGNLEPNERRHYIRELEAMDSNRSVLS